MRPRVLVATVMSVGLSVPLVGCGDRSAPAATTAAGVGATAAPTSIKPTSWVPAPTRNTPSSRAILRAGRAACRGRQPRDLLNAYLPVAREHHAPANLISRAARPPAKGAQARAAHELLAVAVYAYSLPASRRQDAAAGCVYELRKSMSKKSATKDASR